jgi:hypothetical protein
MKKYLVIITLLVAFVCNANALDINSKHRHHKCKGWGKAMLKPKHNWKSYVKYR